MRKTITTIAAVLASFVSFGQADSVTVKTTVDEMTDKVYVLPSSDLIATSDGISGIKIMPCMNSERVTMFIVMQYSLGSACNEDNTLIIKFTDGTKIKMKSWNDFDCETAYFSPSTTDDEKLKTLDIEKIYYQNGRSFQSGTFPVENSRYFIQLYKGL
jgi:hypothetical protein